MTNYMFITTGKIFFLDVGTGHCPVLCLINEIFTCNSFSILTTKLTKHTEKNFFVGCSDRTLSCPMLNPMKFYLQLLFFFNH